MVAATGLTVIDSPSFVIDLRYQRDKNFRVNRTFLDWIAEQGGGGTTVFNLLEVCGILSFNLSEKQLQELFQYFAQHYRIEVLPHSTLESPLPTTKTGDVLDIIAMKAGFADALIIAAIQKHIPGAARFVSWNAEHFRGRIAIPVMTPKEFLDRFS